MIRAIYLFLKRVIALRTWWDNAFLVLQVVGLGVGWWGESFATGVGLMAVATALYGLANVVVVGTDEVRKCRHGGSAG